MYRPNETFTTALFLLIPRYKEGTTTSEKEYPEIEDGIRINASFKTFGGTERKVNELYYIEDTAEVITWYRPDIQSDCEIAVAGTNKIYEIISEPENIDMRNQYIKFKCKRIKGKI